MRRNGYGYFCSKSEFDDFIDKERIIDRFCDDNEIDLHKLFIEETEPDIASEHLEVRKTMAKIIAQIPDKYVVVVPSIHTFSSNPYWRAILLYEFRARGIPVFSAENGTNLAKPISQQDNDLAHMLDSFSAYQESQKFVICHWQTSMNPAKISSWSKPFGNQAGEEHTLEKMLELWQMGFSHEKIATWLNMHIDEYQPRACLKWNANLIGRIIKRETKGMHRPNRTGQDMLQVYKRMLV